MDIKVVWNRDMYFEGVSQDGYKMPMDATTPLGHNEGPNPKELFLVSIAGCSAMDVIGLLKKKRQVVEEFEVRIEAMVKSDHHPVVYTSIHLLFDVKGEIPPKYLVSAIELSQTKYCGVSAMVYKTVPIKWTALLNGKVEGSGVADFEKYDELYQTSYEG